AASALDRPQALADHPPMDHPAEHDWVRLDSPEPIPSEFFTDETEAVDRLELIYETHVRFLRERFETLLAGEPLARRVRATYPRIRVETTSYAKIDTRLS